MILSAAGVPQDLALSRDYDAIFSQLQAAGISVFTPNTQYQENPEVLTLGLESDFLPPPYGTADPSIYEAMRAHGITLVISADRLYNPNEPMPAPENDPLLALIAAAGRDLIHAIYGYDEPAHQGVSVAASQALYEHIKSIDPTLQVIQIHRSVDETNAVQLTPEGLTAYLDLVEAHAQWADIVGFDVYPIGLSRGAVTPYSNGLMVSPEQAITDYMRWLETELPQSQHAIVLQAFNVLDLYSDEMLATLNPETIAALTPPTPEELAGMLSAAHEADEIYWWGQSHITDSTTSQLWQDVLSLTTSFMANYSGNDIVGTSAAETLVGTEFAERIAGAGGDDMLYGGDGNDTLVGGTGADMMDGGAGSDIYYIDNANDEVSENGAEGVDSIRTNLSVFSLSSVNVSGDIENLVGTLGTGQVLSGNAVDNVISGSWGNDTLSGGGGSDTLRGGAGDDSYHFDGTGITVDETGTTGTDTILTSMALFSLAAAALSGEIENLTGQSASGQNLSGNTLNNVITGGTGNDTLSGGGGHDTLRGGGGGDVYIITDVEVADETGGEGSDEIRTALSGFDLKGANVQGDIEMLTGTSDAGQFLVGNVLNNIIIAGAGDDTLDGDAGDDLLYGGLGDDLYLIGQTNDAIFENAASGIDTVVAGASFTLSANIERLLLTGNAAINATGNALANEIQGNSAANAINGGAGADSMFGGNGDDIYYVDNANDLVVETNAYRLTGGVDTVYSLIANYSLGANIERLVLNGNAAINATGNALANDIQGNSVANAINGGAGADSMAGGDGNDIYYVDNSGDVVSETNSTALTGGVDSVYSSIANYTLGVNVENGRIVTGSAANLAGNTLNNLIYAGAGNNVLNGAAGWDTASYAFATSAVTVSLAVTVAQATGGSGSDILIGFEYLCGSAFDDMLTGNSGSNELNGGLGADRLYGGDGSDYYRVDNAGDMVVETNASLLTGGTDLVYSYLTGYTLGTNVENGRILHTGSANLTGNSINNVLYAGAGSNILNGAAGTDTASYAYAATAVTIDLGATTSQATGGSGSDTLIAIENVSGSNFNDTLTGNGGANVLSGGGGADRLTGGAGNDTLIGGIGNDNLLGGAGLDAFMFNTALGAGNVDLIQGYSSVEDTIYLENTGIFTALGLGSLTSGAFNTGVAASQADDRIIYNSATGALLYDADGTGVVAAVQFATISALTGTLTAADFLII